MKAPVSVCLWTCQADRSCPTSRSEHKPVPKQNDQCNVEYVTVTTHPQGALSMVGSEIENDDKLMASQRVLESAEFTNAERLKDFLSYVVEQDVAGQTSAILGKTILEDVYHKDLAKGSNSENVVRVDASRLRQRLELYYATEGKNDDVRIYIDKGGYSPRFERMHERQKAGMDTAPSPLVWFAGIGIATALIFSAASTMRPQTEAAPTVETISQDARFALFQNNPTSLLARNMASEARELLFPAAQILRVSSALEMFEEVTRLDPSYYGGYAGASQASTLLAGLSPDPEKRLAYAAAADRFADKALALDSTQAWSHSAKALIQMVQRDFASAVQSSKTAIRLDPDNLHALEIDAIVAFFAGDFERVVSSADPLLHANRLGAGLPWRNALGNAYFHLGDYENSIHHLTEALRNGGPISEINTVHLIASYQASGQGGKAAELVDAFQTSWPDSRLSAVLGRLFKDLENAERALAQMRAAGWVDPLGQ